jgi:hypothetical protein
MFALAMAMRIWSAGASIGVPIMNGSFKVSASMKIKNRTFRSTASRRHAQGSGGSGGRRRLGRLAFDDYAIAAGV